MGEAVPVDDDGAADVVVAGEGTGHVAVAACGGGGGGEHFGVVLEEGGGFV